MIHLSLPANGHEAFFDAMIPHLESGQTVIVDNGRILILKNGLKRDAHCF